MPADLTDVVTKNDDFDSAHSLILTEDFLAALGKYSLISRVFESIVKSAAWLHTRGIILFPFLNQANGERVVQHVRLDGTLDFIDLRMNILSNPKLNRVELTACFGTATSARDPLIVNHLGHPLVYNPNRKVSGHDVWKGLLVAFCTLAQSAGIPCVTIHCTEETLGQDAPTIKRIKTRMPNLTIIPALADKFPQQDFGTTVSCDLHLARPGWQHVMSNWISLRVNNPMVYLNLSNAITSKHTRSSLVLVAHLMQQGLESLDLSENKIDSHNIDPVLSVLSKDPALCKLNLSGNRLDNVAAQYLAQALIGNSHLESLVLQNNNITEVHTFKIVLSSTCTALRRLDFWNNPIGARHALHLLTALPSNEKLETLNIASDFETKWREFPTDHFQLQPEDFAAHIFPYLKANTILKELVLRADSFYSNVGQSDLLAMMRLVKEHRFLESFTIVSQDLMESCGLGRACPNPYEACYLEQQRNLAITPRSKTTTSDTLLNPLSISSQYEIAVPNKVAFSNRTTESESATGTDTDNLFSSEQESMQSADTAPTSFLLKPSDAILPHKPSKAIVRAQRAHRAVTRLLRQTGPVSIPQGLPRRTLAHFLMRNKPNVVRFVALDDFRRWMKHQTDDWETEHSSSGLLDGTISRYRAEETSLIPRYGQVVPRLYDGEELQLQGLREAFLYCSRLLAGGTVGLIGLQF